MESIRILGTGSYLPPKVLTNYDLEKSGLDTTHDWIVQRTGVSERRMAEADVTTSDLAYEASRNALKMAGKKVEDVDLIIVATITPDTCCPSAANWLQAKLNATRAVTFDVTAACSGFIFALNVAEQYLKNKTVKNVLVVAAEVMTRTLNWKDRTTCILWGDGAGAALLTLGTEGPELLSTHLHTDGANGQDLLLPGGGSKTTPITHASVDQGLHYLNMIEANLSFRVAVRGFMDGIKEAAEFNRVPIEDIKWFIPHQANIRMFQHLAKSLKIPFEKFYLTLQKYGNISSASCAIALDEAVRDGSIQPNDLICLPVFGGGLTWGSALMRW
ncbi:3-oxoacyl-[acyl-carrier-protein] synthase, KASIII (EC [Olavius sp. associated proteobacterium Delta 1]|nr:3-oxoacyl-[acyl-carrier-protein] synthase, KASIII (EC [Olavius sp. associated proteobacterium Delta 1]